jgi:epoxyqueuosine reductase
MLDTRYAGMASPSSIYHQVSLAAAAAGFECAGIAAIPPLDSQSGAEEQQRFDAWVNAGRSGEMGYLERKDESGRFVRSSLRVAVPWARSVIVCAANYNTPAPRSIEPSPENSGWIARYAWTGSTNSQDEVVASDYHKVFLDRLKTVDKTLQQSMGPFQSRCYVDTGPLVERVYARYAGIGWVGKNTCILNQRLGSWLFLGVILTDIELESDAHVALAEDRCGSCTRCIDACPTGALTTPYQMDASLCISYLTIEKRGTIPEPLRAEMGRQIFGCDICQDVCPWNRKAPIACDDQLQTRAALVNPALDWLARLSAEEFGRLFFGSPIKRAKFAGLQRNIAIAMGNSGLIRNLSQLEEWAQSEDSVLSDVARWSIARINELNTDDSQSPNAPD